MESVKQPEAISGTTMIDGTSSAACPAVNQRKTSEPVAHERIEVDADGVWHIYGYDEARQVLRSDLAKQAGFMAEKVVRDNGATMMRNPPILFLHGDEHHRMRRETNQFFTPTITDKRYREFMSDFADGLIDQLKQKGRADLSDVTMELAMRVAAQIVGLTDSMVPGLNSRLEGMLNIASQMDGHAPQFMPKFLQLFLSQRFVLSFLMLDVKPSIRARRKQPQNDVISYLVSRDYSDLEILTECVVYGVAGMATTREFICVALWHLLENPHLRQRMLVGSQEERYAILHEILRLEPIVGHLYRRTTDVIEIESEGEKRQIPAGTLVDLNIFTANVDPVVMGDNSLEVCPMRPLTSKQGKVPESVLSFGDGYHRCPGAFVAIQESDIFLQKLLQIETLRIERKPDVEFHEIVKGYEFRNFIVAVD